MIFPIFDLVRFQIAGINNNKFWSTKTVLFVEIVGRAISNLNWEKFAKRQLAHAFSKSKLF